MSVNDKMTAIADAIRAYTFSTEKIGLDAMVQGIHDGNQNTKDHYYQEGYLQGVNDGKTSVPFEVQKITVSSNLTSGTNTLLANNEYVLANYTKDGFSVQLIPLTSQTFSGADVFYSYNGNRKLAENENYEYYGFNIYMSSATAFGSKYATAPCNSVSSNGVPYVDSEGNIMMRNNSSNATLKAGDYLVVLSVADIDVEEV